VLYCSVHQWPHYPGTGSADERGSGRGAGYTLNVPLAAGAGDETYLDVFDRLIAPAANAYRPQLVLVSAGFDAHAGDPLANMRLSTEVFGQFTRRVLEVAGDSAEGRLVAVLEGGYDPAALAASVVETLVALDAGEGSLHGGAADGARQWDGDRRR
jgi:acetoin utilization deacetylase AcuC-like enzyme